MIRKGNKVIDFLRQACVNGWVGPDTGEYDHATWQYELTSEPTTIPALRASPDKPTAKQGIGEGWENEDGGARSHGL